MLPLEIQQLNHWSYHENKRPLIPPDKWSQGLSFAEVSASGKPFGLLISPDTPFLVIDVDCPPALKSGIMEQLKSVTIGSQEHLDIIKPVFDSIQDTELPALIPETYTEFSYSMTGLRMLISSKDKPKFAKAVKKAKSFDGQISFRNQFMTITGKKLQNSPSIVKEVPLLSLQKAFGFQEKTEVKDSGIIPEQLPPLETIAGAMESLPIDQNDKLKKSWKEITNSEYSHYYYWLSIGMALHEYGEKKKAKPQAYLLWLSWSKKDEIAFESEESISQKWESFTTGQELPITYKTILKLSIANRFSYPKPIVKKGTITPYPITTEWDNFQYLLEYHSIRLYKSNGSWYVSGDKAVCDKYFTAINGVKLWFGTYYGPMTMDGLKAATLVLCQGSQWHGLQNTHNFVQVWTNLVHDELDLFMEYLNVPFAELPEELQYINVRGKDGSFESQLASKYDNNSTLEYLYKCMNIITDNPEVEFKKLRATFMHIMKFRANLNLEFTENSGMLILYGAENTRKSTFCKKLVPAAFSAQIKDWNMKLNSEKSWRDFRRSLSNSMFVVLDEFEGYTDMKNNSSLFKSVISADSTSQVDIYRTEESQTKRKAIILCTTNQSTHILTQDGSRRLWFLRVDVIDTDAMLKINWHTFYNRLRAEFEQEVLEGGQPWLLTQQDIDCVNEQNSGYAAESDLDIMITEIWDFATPMPDEYLNDIKSIQTSDMEKLLTFSAIQGIIKSHFSEVPKASALKQVLKRKCGKWTGTHNQRIRLKNCHAELVDGMIKQGPHSRWVVPIAKNKTNEVVEDE